VTLSGFAGALREDKGTRQKEKGNPIKRGLGASAFSLEPLSFSLGLVPHFSHESLMENGVHQKVRILHQNLQNPDLETDWIRSVRCLLVRRGVLNRGQDVSMEPSRERGFWPRANCIPGLVQEKKVSRVSVDFCRFLR
jgi:hypothetical protein